MKRTRWAFMFWFTAISIMGCSQAIETHDMIGMSVGQMEENYQLKNTLYWDTPNLPIDSEGEKTYFLDQGDLVIRFDADGLISTAKYEGRETSPKERLNSIHKGWSVFVEGRNRKNDSIE